MTLGAVCELHSRFVDVLLDVCLLCDLSAFADLAKQLGVAEERVVIETVGGDQSMLTDQAAINFEKVSLTAEQAKVRSMPPPSVTWAELSLPLGVPRRGCCLEPGAAAAVLTHTL
eukprot:COSAG01_NODE_22807_length_840_cov_1.666667_2_plen_115_part_00